MQESIGTHFRGCVTPSNFISRRSFIQLGTLGVAAAQLSANEVNGPALKPLLTPDLDFNDVSRGTPKPHSLKGAAQIAARLTPESWWLEITADPFVEEPHTKKGATI